MPKRYTILTNLEKATIGFMKWLEEDPRLDMMDRLFIENHLQMALFTYATWKARDALREKSEQLG